jgi:glycosyltransferase involved in cell wall biosynthesis
MQEAIDSALAQTYKQLEVIVVNDGSPDDGQTESIAQSYGEHIRYFHKANGGVASALNFGIEKMTGDYFSWLSHDDVYYPNKIETQVNLLEGMSDKDTVLWSDLEFIDENSQPIGIYRAPRYDVEGIRYSILIEPSIHGCTLLIPKHCFEVCGTFREDLLTTQDYALWFKMGRTFKFIHIDDILIKSRQHANQGSLTIASHQNEKERLYTSFLTDYFHHELANVHDKIDYGQQCLNIANAMLKRNLPKSSLLALKYSKDSVFGMPSFDKLKLYLSLAQYLKSGFKTAAKKVKRETFGVLQNLII